jgi:hypothetical protein
MSALKEDYEKIISYGWSQDEVLKYLDLSQSTVREILYRKNKSENVSSRSKSTRINIMRLFLDKVAESGGMPDPKLIAEIPIMKRDFSIFVKLYYNLDFKLLNHIIDEAVERYKLSRLNIDYLSLFRQKYGDINEQNMTEASRIDPQFMADFITHGNIRNITKAIAISCLGSVANNEYLGFIRTRTTDKNHLIREMAYDALACYYFEDEDEHASVLEEFKESLRKGEEKSPGVIMKINQLITLMETYQS